VHSDEAAAIAGKEYTRCDPSRRSRRTTGRDRGVLTQLRHFLEPELPAVEYQHALFAGRARRLYTNFLKRSANLVKLVLAEIGHRNSLASGHGGLSVDGFLLS
jgi:hypothetical protein